MKRNHFAKLLGVAMAAMVAVALLAAPAQARTPAPGFERFAGCPSPEENASVAACVFSTVSSGHFKIGNREVPIANPITLGGGTEAGLLNFTNNSKGGLSKTKEKVPGGVIGLTGLTWLLEFLGSEALTLYAVAELAGQPSFQGLSEFTLPLKFHLINSVLGNNCYVGSSSSPVVLHLTTGTTSPPPPTEPITGSGPSVELIEGGIRVAGTYVENAFAAPGASGCVLTLFGFIPISINSLVNSTSGLPAAAGTNETVQQITTDVVGSESVYP
jgi:hypothetical protein